MAKRPNLLETETITISTTEQVKKLLAQLVLTGFYGKNEAEAAERIISRWLEGQVEGGKIKPPSD